jgi:PAS domain-containing protein
MFVRTMEQVGESGAQVAGFLRARQTDILASWEREVLKLPAAQRLDPVTVSHGMAELLEEIERSIEGRTPEQARVPVVESHAIERLEEGFDVVQMLEEFTTLHRCILAVFNEAGVLPGPAARQTLDQAIGRTAAACIRYYERAREPEPEAAHDAERSRLEALLRAAPEGIGFVDREFRYVRVNPALAAMNGR